MVFFSISYLFQKGKARFKIFKFLLLLLLALSTKNVKSQISSDFFKYEINDFWIYSVSETEAQINDLEKFTVRDTTLTPSGLNVLIIKETLTEQKIDTILYVIKADSSLYSNQFYENHHLIYNSKIKVPENYWFGGETDILELPYAIYTLKNFFTENLFGKDRLIKFNSITISDDTTGNHVFFGVENIGFGLAQDLGVFRIFGFEGGETKNLSGGMLKGEVFGDTTFKMTTNFEDLENLPSQFRVSNNYPNPFNPNTTFEVSLVKSSNLKVDIFKINGQRVHTVIDRVFPSGLHTINISSDKILQMNSGVYIVRFEANEFLISKKITLIK